MVSADGRYIVVFDEGVAPGPAAAELARQHGIGLSHVYSSALKGFSGTIPEGRLLALGKDPRVKLVEPDLVMHVTAQTLPTGVNRIDADLNAVADIDGSDERVNVTVAVIDTGIDLDHPDLNVDTNLSKSFDSRDSVDTGDDVYGHGTHVAGIIGALDNDVGVVGVAPGVSLVSVRVLGADGGGYLSDIIAGIDYVTSKADVISVANMSLGGTGVSSAYRTAIANSVAKGVVYVVAAGNSGKDIYGRDGTFGTRDDFIPAAYPEVATVSALADSDGVSGGLGAATSYGPDDSFASFSNYSRQVVSYNPVASSGAAIDLMLPGVGILSAYLNGGYDTMSGTSMAAPHAAGLAALYIADKGRATTAAGVYAIRQALIDAGKAQNDPLSGLTTLNDKDSNPEKLGWAASTVSPPPPPEDTTPPSVTWSSPLSGSTVIGSVAVRISASDDVTAAGALTVEWRVDEEQPRPASYNEGYYEAQWDTTGWANGEHTLLATATDAGGNQAFASITVTVSNPTPPPPTESEMYVSAITWQMTGPHLKAIVTVRADDGDGVPDSDDAPLAGVSVSFRLSRDGTLVRVYNLITNSDGQATFQLKSAPKGTYLGEVIGLTLDGYAWAPWSLNWSTYILQ